MAVIVLFVWSILFGEGIGIVFGEIISPLTVILASVTALASALLYLWIPKDHLLLYSLGVYLLLAITAGNLIVESGGAVSPLVAIWMLIAVFAGVFGGWALLPMTLAVVTYGIWQTFIADEFSNDMLLATLFAGVLPLIVSYVMWHRQGEHENGKDKAYRELANELSQVSGKSDAVINAIADGVIALDSKGVIELINPAAQQIIGWRRQDALGLDYKSVLKLLDSKDQEPLPHEDPVAQALSTNKSARSEKLILLTEAKKRLLLSIVVSPIGQSGSGVIIVFRDVTKEKAEERQQAEFISTASHEMRTPVASIEGYLGLALNPATASIDEKARDYITKAHESARHLGRLFQDLLDVSKAEDGRLSNDPSVVNVVEFAAGVVEGLQPKATEKGLRLIYKPKPDGNDTPTPTRHSFQRTILSEKTLTPVYYANVDNDHLREVIANLVENAIKYTLKGDITVDITGDADHITISVQDSGIGIPAEDMSHLFQKFYRVDNTSTREIGGTGLGLYLCRRLTETMSGRIWAESEYKRGSTFYVELPRIDHVEAMQLIEEASEQASTEDTGPQIIIPEGHQTLPLQPQPDASGYAPQPSLQGQQPATYAAPSSSYTTPSAPAPLQPTMAAPIQPLTASPQPVAATQPQQVPQPIAMQPTQTATPQAAPARYVTLSRRQPVNTPLSAIEQSPSQYATRPIQTPQLTPPPPNPQTLPPNQP